MTYKKDNNSKIKIKNKNICLPQIFVVQIINLVLNNTRVNLLSKLIDIK